VNDRLFTLGDPIVFRNKMFESVKKVCYNGYIDNQLSKEEYMSDNANLPVELKLQVGEVAIPLAQLLELNVGSVVEEGATTFFPKVRALVGDRAIAEGELVDVEGRIAFRVTKML
jgi:flagellar motor switch/type III secretory pathway protein FliN